MNPIAFFVGLWVGTDRRRVSALDEIFDHMQIRNFSFGATAAIVTSIGLIVGFDAATASKATILSGLLIVAIADNLTDSLSVHIYQESERLEPRQAFHATLFNFVARLGLSLSFVLLMVILPLHVAVLASMLWGLLLLTGLSYLVARARKLPVLREIAKHVAVAAVVMFSSKMIGDLFSA
jgi:VIT1/CCC1 family predicted Fe2+/Mn2+ transporter